MKDKIILYRPNAIAEHIEVRLEEETVWLHSLAKPNKTLACTSTTVLKKVN